MKYHYIVLLSALLFSVFLFIPAKEKFQKTQAEDQPSEWFIAQRIYPYGKMDYDAYGQAFKQKKLMVNSGTERDEFIWESEGPFNVGGRVQDIEMDPTNTDIIYAGAASGGIFKSTDGGINWMAIFDDQPSLSIGDLAIAPSNPSIIYAGTGEPNCGGGSVTYDGAGVFKSADAGETWNYAGLDSTRNTGRIVIDPKNSDRVFVATMGDLFANGSHRGVYRTTDGGITWEQVLFISDSTGAIDLSINPQHPDTIFACMWERERRPTYEHYGGSTCGIFRSYDGGNTWTELTNGLPSGSNVGRIGIDISQSNPATLYSIYADATGYFVGIYKTTDNGDTWTQTNDAGLGSMFASYGWWFGRIKVDPTNENIAYAIGFEEFKTSNGGSSWNSSSGIMHVDHHTLFIHPLNHNLLLDGNDGGIYKSTDGSVIWNHFENLSISQFYTSEINNSNTVQLYGGTQDNNVIRTLTGELSDWESIIGGDGFYVLVDPVNPSYVYAESQYGYLNRSSDGGNNFSGATSGINSFDRKNWNTPVVFNPKNPASLYYGANRLYKSMNRAIHWSAISNDLSNGSGGGNITFGTITSISVSPVDTNIIYAGTDDGNVWVTMNNGAIWDNISASLPDRWVTRVTCDPKEVLRAYVTFSGYRFDDDIVHVYMTDDAGQTWQSISGDLPDVPANDILVDSLFDSVLYLATDIGVFTTDNLGNSWTVLGDGLPTVPVTDLTFNDAARLLVAATYGRSMYSVDLNLFTALLNVNEPFFTVSVFPTLVTDFLTVKIDIEKEAVNNVQLSLINEAGVIVWNSESHKLQQGSNSFQFLRTQILSEISHGIFFLRISIGGKSVVKKVILI